MTCIVGYRNKGSVWIGGDSAGVAGFTLTVRQDPKVFRNGEFLFGFTSSFRMGDILRYSFHAPKRGTRSVDNYLRTVWIDAVRQAMATGGYRKKTNEQEEGGAFLLGYAGRLFSIATDFQVGEARDPFDAVGCGEDFARGAMFALSRHRLSSPRKMVGDALRSAERGCAGVRGPFRILSLPKRAK